MKLDLLQIKYELYLLEKWNFFNQLRKTKISFERDFELEKGFNLR